MLIPDMTYPRGFSLQLTRQKFVWKQVAAISGHCNFGLHASRLGIQHNNYCRSCQNIDIEESTFHILWNSVSCRGKPLGHKTSGEFSRMQETCLRLPSTGYKAKVFLKANWSDIRTLQLCYSCLQTGNTTQLL